MLTPQQLAAGLRAFADAIEGVASGAGAQTALAQTQQQPPAAQTYAAQPQNNGLLSAAPANPPPVNVTSDQITALIQPHVGNEQIKAELGAAMRAMGINALPETQPHQYGDLYQRFQAIIAKFTGGGQQQQMSSTSII